MVLDLSRNPPDARRPKFPAPPQKDLRRFGGASNLRGNSLRVLGGASHRPHTGSNQESCVSGTAGGRGPEPSTGLAEEPTKPPPSQQRQQPPQPASEVAQDITIA
ncbi:hypothetical protein GGTG_11130 [Gaeumannomyces tritici R3-111a-1]|uniref:Uncharacterized protein n=1 Tax=Gaeumannomyces tritici (strain R3-111a-1) TaxID=644352 RepID=J3PCA7_GAET3|nr:hypothetical protein GGTG_11130 [Gaeumannomyces tritici R3-111a-1]EJT71877.1 hypothetical protein GGTG_11130 [Gaeumannomyces tritici R3-111a-1]